MEPTVKISNEPRPFTAVLQELNRGELCHELTAMLNELVHAVQVNQKGGTLVLKLKLEPKEGAEMVLVHTDVDMKKPKQARPASMFFIDHELNLVRNDPRQMSFADLRRPAAPPEPPERPEPAPEMIDDGR